MHFDDSSFNTIYTCLNEITSDLDEITSKDNANKVLAIVDALEKIRYYTELLFMQMMSQHDAVLAQEQSIKNIVSEIEDSEED